MDQLPLECMADGGIGKNVRRSFRDLPSRFMQRRAKRRRFLGFMVLRTLLGRADSDRPLAMSFAGQLSALSFVTPAPLINDSRKNDPVDYAKSESRRLPRDCHSRRLMVTFC